MGVLWNKFIIERSCSHKIASLETERKKPWMITGDGIIKKDFYAGYISNFVINISTRFAYFK